jgi:hypothetical protein
MSKHLLWIAAGVGFSCASQAHVEEQPQPTAAAEVAPAPSSAPEPEPSAAAIAEPAPAPEPEAAPGKRPAPPPSGRPAIQIGPQKKIASTFGSTPASVLKLKTAAGDFALKLNEYALRTGTNIVFETGAKVMKGKASLVGELAHLTTQVGDSNRLSEVEANAAPFIVVVPSKKSVNLAIGVMELDDSGLETGKVKEWRVLAPARFDEGLGQVVFELDRIGPSVMHATTSEPTEKPASAAAAH